MRFWLREVFGWLLVALGLGVFYLCWVLLTRMLPDTEGRYGPAPALLEVGPLAFIGFVIFRGGIHLLKVAVAARICLTAQERLAQGGDKPPRRQVGRGETAAAAAVRSRTRAGGPAAP
jgi:hypothetical protein